MVLHIYTSHFFFRFQHNSLALNYSLKSLLYNTKMAGCVPYRPLYIYATTSGNLKSIRRIPQNQTFRFYLSCLVRLWRPRFSAGRGTYSPYRRSAPHPPWRIRLSAPGGNRTAWMMPFPSFGYLPCTAMAFVYSHLIWNIRFLIQTHQQYYLFE